MRVRASTIAACTAGLLALGACVRRSGSAPGAASDGAPHPRAATPTGTPCAWSGGPAVLYQAADTLYQVWTLPASRAAAAWRPAAVPARAAVRGGAGGGPADVPALAAFRRDVAARLHAAGAPADLAGLLRRQVAYYAARSDSDSRREAENSRRVLAGAAGAVRPLSCVEALLLDSQARRFDMARRPTEFHAFILRRDASVGAPAPDGPLLVYFAASGAPWPPRVGRLTPLLEAKVREGWRLAAHLHNHPFYLDRLAPDSAPGRPSADIAGAVAPSITDVQFYRSFREGLGLERARVTNGLATLELPAEAFARLHARGEASAP